MTVLTLITTHETGTRPLTHGYVAKAPFETVNVAKEALATPSTRTDPAPTTRPPHRTREW